MAPRRGVSDGPPARAPLEGMPEGSRWPGLYRHGCAAHSHRGRGGAHRVGDRPGAGKCRPLAVRDALVSAPAGVGGQNFVMRALFWRQSSFSGLGWPHEPRKHPRAGDMSPHCRSHSQRSKGPLEPDFSRPWRAQSRRSRVDLSGKVVGNA